MTLILKWYSTLKEFSDKHHTACKLLVFFGSAGLMMLLSYLWTGSLVYYNGDSRLYISIADNFLDNGHFIQTYRSSFENFIVPPGYPLVLTIIRFFSRNDLTIAMVQYAIFGLSSVLLYCSERNIFGNIGGISVLLNCLMIWRIHYAGPGCVVTETLYSFAIVFCVWILSRKDISDTKRVSAWMIIGFFGMIIRPVLSIIFFASVFYAIYQIIKKKYSIRYFAAIIAVCILLLTANGYVNFRETGHFELFEGYSGISVYLANNDTITENGVDFGADEYSYADEQFNSIYLDDSLDYYEKDELIGDMGTKYALTHPLATLRNWAVKSVYMYITYWYGLVLIAVLGVLLAYRYRRERVKELTVLLWIFGTLAVVTPLGLAEPRYVYAIFPFFTLFSAAAAELGIRRFLPEVIKYIKSRKPEMNNKPLL